MALASGYSLTWRWPVGLLNSEIVEWLAVARTKGFSDRLPVLVAALTQDVGLLGLEVFLLVSSVQI